MVKIIYNNAIKETMTAITNSTLKKNKNKNSNALIFFSNIIKCSIFLVLFSTHAFAQKKIIIGSGSPSSINLSNYYQKSQIDAKIDSLNTVTQPLNITAGQGVTTSGVYPNITINATPTPASNSVTEEKRYYHGEIELYKSIDTTTGEIITDSTKIITGYIPIEGGVSVKVFYVADGLPTVKYGWTYDSSLTPIAPIRSAAYSLYANRGYGSYTFTTPANARYIVVNASTYALTELEYLRLRINSSSAITYNTPITPEQFTGTQTEQIQKAVNFASWTTSGVELKGNYILDTGIILRSGTKVILNNARLQRSLINHDNFFRNEAVATQSNIFPRGNKDISIIGVGNAIIEGSNSGWGGSTPLGFGDDYWRVQDILFGNVDGFNVSGLTFKGSNGAAFYMEQCRYGSISNIEFAMDLAHPNQGGIAITSGSHNINCDNIRGVCMDDFFAVYNMGLVDTTNAILGTPLTAPIYTPYKTDKDVYGINATNLQRGISNKFSGQYYGNAIRIQSTNGLKIRDVNIDRVTGYQNFLIYSVNNYGPMYAGTISNLTISNVDRAGIYISKGISNSHFINIPSTDSSHSYLSCVLPDSSYNNVIQYIGQPAQYIDSVMGSVYYTSTKSNAFNFTPLSAAQASSIVSPAAGKTIFVNGTNATFTSIGWWGWNGSAWKKLDN